ncbi:MAG: IS110 family transposase [Chloroflexi bacterium]|nr:IS110 family transposase [Chloroflexota bacterium]
MDTSQHWRERFERLRVRLGDKKAIIAIARKLLVLVWHVLSKHAADRHAEEERVARKLLSWSVDVHREGRQGHSIAAFVREQLTVLGLGESLESVTSGSRVYRLLPGQAPTDSEPARHTP